MAAIDSRKLQEVVEKMAKPRGNGTWELDRDYAPEFFNLVKGYVQKATYKSDRYDPEDTCSEIYWNLWRALERYGPRPQGNDFASYTLKLKVNNILTNAAKKRRSAKSRINFMTKSLDQMEEDANVEGKGRSQLLRASQEEEWSLPKKRALGSKKATKNLIEIFKNLSISENKKLFQLFLSAVSGREIDEIKEMYKNLMEFMKLIGLALYNEEEDNEMKVDLSTVKVGNKYLTKEGKRVIEIRGKCRVVHEETKKVESGYKIFVFFTKKEIGCPESYIRDCVVPYDENFDESVFEKYTIEYEPEKQITEVEELPVKEEEVVKNKRKPKIRISSRDFLDKNLNTKTKEEKEEKGEKAVRKGTDHDLVLAMLREGSQTQEALARAIIEKSDKRSEDDLKKVKNWVSVIIWNLKNKKGCAIVSPKRGVYELEKETSDDA